MKRFSILVFCLCFAQGAMAQTITLGPKIGANFSSLKSSNPDQRYSTEHFTGWAAGVFVRANLGPLYLQPEVYFNEQGSNLRIRQNPNDPNQGDTPGRVRLTTMDVPVLVGVRLIPLQSFNLRLMAGPVYTRVINERVNDLQLLNRDSYSFEKENFGYQAGAGIDIGKLTFDLRYQGTINEFNKSFDQRSSLWHAMVGFKLF